MATMFGRTTKAKTPTSDQSANAPCPSAVQRAQAGDREAFGEIYQTYVEPVQRYVRSWVREPADAEDITSEVFTRAFSSIHKYHWEGKAFAAWLFTIARNAIIDRRRRQRPTVDLAEATQLASEAPTALELAMKSEEFSRLVGAMDCLTEDQKAVVKLRYVEDLPSARVGDAIGRGNGAVRALQFRAVARLRRELREEPRYEDIVAEWAGTSIDDDRLGRRKRTS